VQIHCKKVCTLFHSHVKQYTLYTYLAAKALRFIGIDEMNRHVKKLRESFNLVIESPFLLPIENKVHRFDCLIVGYGAKNGMIVDKKWSKIHAVESKLMDMGYGYSCFDIEADSSIEEFRKVLDEWGQSNT